jgi:hypothetical protein
MTTHSTTAEDRLARLGIHLPDGEAAYTAALNVLALTKKQLGGPSPRASSLVSRAFRSVRRSSWRSSWKCSPEAPVSPGHRLPIRQAATRQISAPSRRNTRMAWS